MNLEDISSVFRFSVVVAYIARVVNGTCLFFGMSWYVCVMGAAPLLYCCENAGKGGAT